MVEKEKKSKKIKKKLLHKYRLVILNESTFEEKISFKLSRLNVFVTGSILAIALIALTTVFIAFTPLREYIPGYSSTKLKQQATALTYQTDSLVNVLNYTNKYLDNIKMVLRGDINVTEVSADSIFQQFKLDPASINLTPIKEDSILRNQVAIEDKYNLFERNIENVDLVLFPPVTGSVTQGYDVQNKHYAVDITAPTNTPVKSVADGIVIFSDWTVDTGYVLIISHKDELLSVYKHNGLLLKQQGDAVVVGEVIAAVGNTGELTTGAHLHFELWNDGNPVNPLDYIDFN